MIEGNPEISRNILNKWKKREVKTTSQLVVKESGIARRWQMRMIEGIPNGRTISLRISGRDGLRQELGMSIKGHYKVGKMKGNGRGTQKL